MLRLAEQTFPQFAKQTLLRQEEYLYQNYNRREYNNTGWEFRIYLNIKCGKTNDCENQYM